MKELLLIHAAATWALVGLIWTIQVVHYPLFARVGVAQFVAYHRAHTRRIAWVVGPLMLVELGTALLLCMGRQGQLVWWVSLLPLAYNWSATGWVQVPLHRQLGARADPALIQRLVRSNWGRTWAWTLRGLLLLWVLG